MIIYKTNAFAITENAFYQLKDRLLPRMPHNNHYGVLDAATGEWVDYSRTLTPPARGWAIHIPDWLEILDGFGHDEFGEILMDSPLPLDFLVVNGERVHEMTFISTRFDGVNEIGTTKTMEIMRKFWLHNRGLIVMDRNTLFPKKCIVLNPDAQGNPDELFSYWIKNPDHIAIPKPYASKDVVLKAIYLHLQKRCSVITQEMGEYRKEIELGISRKWPEVMTDIYLNK